MDDHQPVTLGEVLDGLRSRGRGGLSTPTLSSWPVSATHDRRSEKHEDEP
jgi:hypothetical protein